jgi:hypothetical protein
MKTLLTFLRSGLRECFRYENRIQLPIPLPLLKKPHRNAPRFGFFVIFHRAAKGGFTQADNCRITSINTYHAYNCFV